MGTPLSGAPTAAGTYTVVASFAGSADYLSTSAQTTFTISQAMPTVAVSANGGVYNGQGFAVTATVNGGGSLEGVTPTLTWYSGTSASGTPLSSAPVNAGTYTVVASFAGSADYTSGSAQTTFTISKATPTVSVTGGTFSYTGSAQAASGLVTGVGGASLGTPTLTYYAGATATGTPLSSPPVNIDTYTVVASYPGSQNYSAASATATITITKATPTFSVLSEPAIVVGTSSTTLSGKISAGVLTPSGNVTITVNGVSITAAIKSNGTFSAARATTALKPGSYTISYRYAGGSLFNAVSGTATMTVSDNVKVLSSQTQVYQAGSTIPVQIQLLNASGTNISSSRTVGTVVGFAPTSNPSAIQAVPTSASKFTYASGSYKYSLQTPSTLAAGSYLLFFTVQGDPVTHSLTFLIKNQGTLASA
jgi:hypothetical protein